jgi:hypothetical protein
VGGSNSKDTEDGVVWYVVFVCGGGGGWMGEGWSVPCERWGCVAGVACLGGNGEGGKVVWG